MPSRHSFSGLGREAGSTFGVSGSETAAVSVLAAVEREGLFANMSRMFRRLSNSGMSFPDKAGRSLVEYSLSRLPSRKVPGGFMMSRMSTSSSSQLTRSLMVA